ncbi:MAG: response regulator transcription factor [Defluviitaleaceae bacterium]|nr:response regulator transcription factor [Defluviitaleaceae bacterium]
MSEEKKTVMVVEDDRHINEVVTAYLTESGFAVVSFSDGKAALTAIETGAAADLFVLDIMLPGASGLTLLQAIRARERYNDVPVMMLTAIADEYTQLTSFEALADDYVTKPFSPKVLVKRAQALMRRRGDLSVSREEGVFIDADGYQAYENGSPVKLTLREFELLKLFWQNKNLVFTRQQLLDAVWGYDYYGDERIVDAHIKNLRKKFTAPVVATVKGVGYRAEKTETGGRPL